MLDSSQLDHTLTGSPNTPNANFGFVSKYKSYMDDWAAQRSTLPSYMPQLIESIENDLQTSRCLTDFNEEQWQSFLQRYDEHGGMDWDSVNYHVSFRWDTTNVPRDLEIRADLCAPEPSSTPICEIQ